MSYEKKTWVNGTTPCDETNMNHLETQYDEILKRIKAGSVTETTGGDGKIAVNFAAAFASTPVVVVTLFGDVDYYPVITAKSTAGFTVKMLKTAHKHSQGNTSTAPTHTHSFSDTSSSEGSHSHTQGATGSPSSTTTIYYNMSFDGRWCASTSGGATTTSFGAVRSPIPTKQAASSTHTHTNPSTSSAGSHTHSISGTSGAGGSHSHTNPDTAEANAGNLLATTEVTFSYIAMIP